MKLHVLCFKVEFYNTPQTHFKVVTPRLIFACVMRVYTLRMRVGINERNSKNSVVVACRY